MSNRTLNATKTPNANAIQFFDGNPVLKDGLAVFSTPERAENSPVAAELFKLPNVITVLLAEDHLTVTRKPSTQPALSDKGFVAAASEIVNRHINSAKPLIKSAISEETIPTDDPRMLVRVEELINEKINPKYRSHGGRVQIISLEDDILTLRQVGACLGCGLAKLSADGVKESIEDVYSELTVKFADEAPVARPRIGLAVLQR